MAARRGFAAEIVDVSGGRFTGLGTVALGSSISDAQAVLGVDWICKAAGPRTSVVDCHYTGSRAGRYFDIGIIELDDGIVSIAIALSGGESIEKACIIYIEALNELSKAFGPPSARTASLCEMSRPEPSVHGSCSQWGDGANTLRVGVFVDEHNLNEASVSISVSELPGCRAVPEL